ncbi:MAG: hypothetical protein K1X86_03260 [Ignavibacteria bacterium]|nr:hypothetical protein [Ignavibacteria bacterium]
MAIGSLFFTTTGCNDNTLTGGSDTTTVANPNVKVYRGLQVNEDFGSSSYSGVDLYTGTTVLSLNPSRDIEMADSMGLSQRYLIRSGTGDITLDHMDIGRETKFAKQFSSKNMTQAQFDAVTKIDDSNNSLDSTDFTSHSTSYFGKSFTADDYRLYGVFLKGKSSSLPKPVFGLMYLKSLDTLIVGGNMSLRLTFDVKLNTNGQNDFRERIPSN